MIIVVSRLLLTLRKIKIKIFINFNRCKLHIHWQYMAKWINSTNIIQDIFKDSLISLEFSRGKNTEIPEKLFLLSKLKSVSFKDCDQLESLSNVFFKNDLKKFEITGCNKINGISKTDINYLIQFSKKLRINLGEYKSNIPNMLSHEEIKEIFGDNIN